MQGMRKDGSEATEEDNDNLEQWRGSRPEKPLPELKEGLPMFDDDVFTHYSTGP